MTTVSTVELYSYVSVKRVDVRSSPGKLAGIITLVVFLLGLFASAVSANAQIINGNFENRTPHTTVGNCVTGTGVATMPPDPWGRQSTPDYSTESIVAFHSDFQTRTALSPTFNLSPDGGCFMGFRSLSATANEGIYQTITIANAAQPLQFNYDYTEYTQPTYSRCTPLVEFRVNGNDDSNGTSISTAPNVGAPNGPSAEGEWVSLSTSSFTPSDYGIADGGTMDIYLGVVANGCVRTWAFVDAIEISPSAPTIRAEDDSASGINGLVGTPNVLDVLADNGAGIDTLDGVQATLSTTNINVTTPATPVNIGDPVPVLDPLTGLVSVPAGTPASTYTITYFLCDNAFPSSCDPATVTIIVNPAPILAADDTPPAINGLVGGDTPTVFTNDTLNGNPFVPADVTPTIVTDGGLTGVMINPDGTLTVPADTPAGTYPVEYQICEVLNPANCDTAIATITVDPAAIVATDDDLSGTPVNGLVGGDTPTVFTNDTLNGNPFVPADVTPTIVTDGGLTGVTINPDGTLTVPADTPAGVYPVEYQICEVLNPTNCDPAIATITVDPAPIVAADDTPPAVNGLVGGDTPTVFTNDTLNGNLFAPADVTPTIVTDGGLTGVMINPDGTLTVPADTPAGTYPVEYQICEVLNPANCDTAIATITVDPAAIVATDDDLSGTPVNGLVGGDTPTVFTNDTLNGNPFVPADVTPTIVTDGGLTGVTINPDGTLTVPADTPAGVYPVEYQICEVLNPTNCDPAIATITVDPAPIVAADDTPPAVNGLVGGDTPTVFTNDTLNGNLFAPADVTPTIVTDGGLTGVMINPDGTLTVPADTPAGTYPVEYQICEVLNPANCDTAIATVTVDPAPIVAVAETIPALNGTSGEMTTVTILDSDTLDGAAVVPADVAVTINSILDPSSAATTAIVVNGDNTITVAPGTPAGDYTINYTICENLNPTNCDTVTETVTVAPAAIVATDDDLSGTPVNGLVGGDTPTVFTNDTLNGNPFAPADVTPTIVTDGGLTGVMINPDGTLTVPADTPAGVYPVEYQICEVLNPTNCDTAIATITVDPAAIVATDDDLSGTPVNGLVGGDTPTVFTNDTLNGNLFVPADVTPTIVTDGGLTGVTINPDGTLTVPADTPAGVYPVEYQICEVLNPTNCDTAIATITVDPAAIVATDDDLSGTPVNGLVGGDTPTVFTNDTLNGNLFVPADVTPTIVTDGGLTGVTINPDGTLTVPADTPAGVYPVEYQICEVLNPTNCDPAIATITVDPAPIVAADDTPPAVNGLVGGDTPTVFTNDTLNGNLFAPADVTPTIVTDGGLTGVMINPDGTLTVPADTPAGTYPVEYQICEVLNPANCDTAIATVTVDPAPIVAVAETIPALNGTSGEMTTVTILDSDTLDGAAVVPADVAVTINSILDPSSAATTAIVVNGDNTITVAPGTPAGDYTINYTICENLNPTNCDTVTETVTVAPAAIVATDDDLSGTPVNGLVGGDTPTVFTNDTLNGNPFAPADVTPTIVTDGGLTGVMINPDGTLTVPADTPAGTYPVEYQICEVLNPANCDTAIATITVDPAAIVATDDTPPAVDGLTGNPNVANAFDNDTLNGNSVDPADITAIITSPATPNNPGDPVPVMDPVTGIVSVPPLTPAGTYDIVYEICEILNPANCDTATVTVVVSPPQIDAVDDTVTDPVDTAFALTNVINVLDGDTYAGSPATVANVTVAPVGTLPTGFTLNPDGSVDIAQFTPSGIYTFQYEICDVINPTNCDIATVTIPVEKSVPLLSGTVYLDNNGDGVLNPGSDTGEGGYIVELVDAAGNVVATTISNADGTYEIRDFPVGDDYKVIFRNPDTGVSIGSIDDLDFGPDTIIADQNQPIDPAGVVYNSATGEPISGAVLTLVDASGTPLPAACLLPGQQPQTTGSDGRYSFDVVVGAAAQCPVGETEYRIAVTSPSGFDSGLSALIPPQAGALDATTCPVDAVPGGPCQLSSSPSAPSPTAPTPYYLAFLLQAGDPNVINNHIPLDPEAMVVSNGVTVTKTAARPVVERGGVAPYTITLSNTNLFQVGPIDVVDRLPAGFLFTPDSATIDGVAITPVVSGRDITFEALTIPANGNFVISLSARVSASVQAGEHVNIATAIDPVTGSPIAPVGKAIVRVEVDHVFDCGELIGKVFDDKNRNGRQNDGEKGLPGVRLATVNGMLITTDKHGRYSVPCAALPDSSIGSNFILKLDPRTLPTGYRMTTENPRVVRLTRGKVTKMNFGATISKVFNVDLVEKAFKPGSQNLHPEVAEVIERLVGQLAEDQSVLRLTYHGSNKDLAKSRLKNVEAQIRERWKRQGTYKLSIEQRIVEGG